MNNIQIASILERYKPLKGIFLGVFSANNIKLPHQRPVCFIANTQKTGTLGEHWIACYVPSMHTIEYFDPLGNEANEDIQRVLNEFPEQLMNTIPLQSPLSDACGPFTIYFLVERVHKGQTFGGITRRLRAIQPVEKREHYVQQFIHRLTGDAI